MCSSHFSSLFFPVFFRLAHSLEGYCRSRHDLHSAPWHNCQVGSPKVRSHFLTSKLLATHCRDLTGSPWHLTDFSPDRRLPSCPESWQSYRVFKQNPARIQPRLQILQQHHSKAAATGKRLRLPLGSPLTHQHPARPVGTHANTLRRNIETSSSRRCLPRAQRRKRAGKPDDVTVGELFMLPLCPMQIRLNVFPNCLIFRAKFALRTTKL